MNHSSHELNIYDAGKVAGLFKIVKTFHFHHLTRDFVRNLIAPFVNYRHVYIVNEHGHFFTARRTVRATDSFVYVTFNRTLFKNMEIECYRWIVLVLRKNKLN